ncbi:MAG: oxidoreductase [Lunatimonas sp.]|uniref:putative oxidoreductase C-terminal domain-containing protein n=1 Tax=Lunatimonas sp. TaxID=2060141 RepID=UPI00263ABDDB|nr:putative oxidoreductase C-terminal domain-containing protein [Lunatimonas sp.]MCC5936480.1 oxidoreductase [Lunatimonas sp.]
MNVSSRFLTGLCLSSLFLTLSCSSENKMETSTQTKFEGKENEIKLVTLDPGHFHAHLVKKATYPQVDPKVHVYAPGGPDLQAYLAAIESYNTRAEDPTNWQMEVYAGTDFLEKMVSEKKGNVMVTAGNNRNKTKNLLAAVKGGFHVLADKPMAIDPEGFAVLKEAFEEAEKNDVLLFDIMTERFEISTILQKEFSLVEEVFGSLENGTLDAPAVTKESVHHFYKTVSGKPLQRPGWFYDVAQQGEGIVDVTTHLVDLVQWECFPGKIIDYNNDIEMINATRWATDLTLEEFTRSTGLQEFPEYLSPYIEDGMLKVYGNGEINYKINGVHAKVSVIWNYVAPEGSADTHYSIMRGTKANLVIRQDKKENYKPELYIEPISSTGLKDFQDKLFAAVQKLSEKFPGLGVVKVTDANAWRVEIPESFRTSHEDHFREVTEKYLEYLVAGKLPDWEVPNMIAKYFVTTTALEMAKK